MKRFLSLLPILFVCLSLQAADLGGSCIKDSIRYKGHDRIYWLHVPERISPDAPLLVCLHGYGGIAFRGNVHLVDLADEHGFVVCYPQGLPDPKGKPSWNVGYPSQEGWTMDDVGFVGKLVKHLQTQLGLDPRNAFLIGMSNGGEMCYLLARKKPDLFAGLISIAGLTLECMAPLNYGRPVPFMEVHGTMDKTSYWTGDHLNRYGWGAYLSVPAAVSYVVAADGCTAYSKEDITVEGKKPVFLHKYLDGVPARKGKGHACEVWLYEVVGGGHNWADKEIDTYAEVWKFMDHFMYR